MKSVQVGDVFAGNYRIEAEVARGGMGVIYRALDLGLDRHVALKVMAAALSDDEVYRARFRREAAMAARIDHPHVVPVYFRGEHEGILYVVMRLVDGVDLAEVLRREGRLDLARTSRLVTQVAGALDAAHALGLVHRDVKPANILLQAGDRALLTDFGLAKQASGGGDALTSANILLGTAAYLAPEQAQGKVLDARCDIYALACVVFQCLSGRTPYPEGPAITVAAAHVYEAVPDLNAVAPELPVAVADVIARGLAKDPADRWPSAGAFATALEQTLPGGQTARLPTVSPRTKESRAKESRTKESRTKESRTRESAAGSERRPARRTGVWVVAGALVVVAAGAAGVALGGLRDTGAGPTPTPSGDRHAALVARLPAAVYTSCRPAPAREKKGVVTAVDCLPTEPGVEVVLVSQWVTPAAMAIDFTTSYMQRMPDGKCRSSWEIRSTWGFGRIACYTNSGGAAVLLYAYEKTGLQMLAVRKDGNKVAVYDWWLHRSQLPVT